MRPRPDTPESDLARYRVWQEACRLSEHSNLDRAELSDPLRERLDDHLRPARVSELRAAAAAAPPGSDGEAARRPFRAVAYAYLERVASEPETELYRRRPRVDLDLNWVRDGSPQGRQHEFDLLRESLDQLEALKAECVEERDAAARNVGASSVANYLAAIHPGSIDEILRAFELGAIEPLDEPVGAASRERRARSRVLLIEPEHPADEPVFRTMIEHEGTLPPSEITTILRRIGSALGADPDLRSGPRLVAGLSNQTATRFTYDAEGRPVVLVGGLGGAGGLLRGLAAFGKAARASFIRELYGEIELQFGDPAFPYAAGVLFRRLALNDRFRTASGVEGVEAMVFDLRLEEALAPRASWTYLLLAGQSEPGPPGTSNSERSDEALRRSTGRCADPLGTWRRDPSDPEGVAELRGTVLGLLMEERLLCAFGREWFASKDARRFLREAWESEFRETAESVASALDLGTIEAAPVLDRCRP